MLNHDKKSSLQFLIRKKSPLKKVKNFFDLLKDKTNKYNPDEVFDSEKDLKAYISKVKARLTSKKFSYFHNMIIPMRDLLNNRYNALNPGQVYCYDTITFIKENKRLEIATILDLSTRDVVAELRS